MGLVFGVYGLRLYRPRAPLNQKASIPHEEPAPASWMEILREAGFLDEIDAAAWALMKDLEARDEVAARALVRLI